MILYTRVSTEEQGRSGAGLDAQRNALEAEAQRRGWETQLIVDSGVSAKTTDRPGLREALELIATGEADGLAVAKLDRLARSVIDFSNLMHWFHKANATLVVLDLNVDTSNAAGRLVANVFASVAEWEREIIGERTSVALQARKAQGRPVSRPAVNTQTTILIGQLHEQNLSLRAIAAHLNTNNIPTARGAALWSAATVRSALGHRTKALVARSSDLPEITPRRRKPTKPSSPLPPR